MYGASFCFKFFPVGVGFSISGLGKLKRREARLTAKKTEMDARGKRRCGF